MELRSGFWQYNPRTSVRLMLYGGLARLASLHGTEKVSVGISLQRSVQLRSDQMCLSAIVPAGVHQQKFLSKFYKLNILLRVDPCYP